MVQRNQYDCYGQATAWQLKKVEFIHLFVNLYIYEINDSGQTALFQFTG